MLPSADTKFDYAALPTDKAASARAAAERIRGRMQLAAESIIEVGRELNEQQTSMGRGHFLSWIDGEFSMSQSAAYRFMDVHKRLGDKLPTVGSLPPTALYALAAPSTPETVRTEVLERAAGGEKVTAKEIDAIKRRLKSAEEKIAEKEAQRLAQERRANIAAQQVSDATNRAMFAEADKERLAAELEDVREEMERLREPGVITVNPIQQFNEAFVAPVSEPTPWTDDDAQAALLQYAWDKSPDGARRIFLKYIKGDLAA